jgi:protein transport protein DSL1/ZW10
MAFLKSHFFPHLPHAEASFPATLHIPITSAILTHLLKPSIPSSLPALPSFLEIVDEAVSFEDSLLSGEIRDRPIRSWSDDVAGHYEKKRRESFLRQARKIISEPEKGSTSMVEVSIQQSADSFNHSVMLETDVEAWDFHDERTPKLTDTSTLQTIQQRNGHPFNARNSAPNVQDHEDSPGDEEAASDEWGWGDDGDDDVGDADRNDGAAQDKLLETNVQNSALDDPWDDDGWSTESQPEPPLTFHGPEPDREVSGSTPKVVPKMATRLEKFSAKSKGLGSPNPHTGISPVGSQVARPPLAQPTHPHPPQRRKPVDRETYLVSSRAKEALEIAEDVMREGHQLLNSEYVTRHLDPSNTRITLMR